MILCTLAPLAYAFLVSGSASRQSRVQRACTCGEKAAWPAYCCNIIGSTGYTAEFRRAQTLWTIQWRESGLLPTDGELWPVLAVFVLVERTHRL